jgi:uncharacterized phage protein (TIGR01671 family)
MDKEMTLNKRDIKFRALDDGKMIYPTGALVKLERFFRVIRQDAKLMQYTGAKDIKGKEIYEGDIVRLHTMDSWDIENDKPILKPTGQVSFIEFINNGFWVNKESFGWEGEGLWDWEKLEVIGNIFENPELINLAAKK